MKTRTAFGMAALGAGIIAITYGLARFVFGLVLPAIRADLGIGTDIAGIIGAVPFLSFIGAIAVGPAVAGRLGTRDGAALSAGLAALGLAAIAAAPGPIVLIAGVAVCGIATGLSSPIMARAVHTTVRPALRGRVDATVNAGAAAGIAVAVPATILLQDAWRQIYASYAALAAVGVIAALIRLPRRSEEPDPVSSPECPASPLTPVRRAAIARLSAAAMAMGFVSAIYWVFAPDLTVTEGAASPHAGAWMWLAVGLGGLAGGAAGDLLDRLGVAASHALAMVILSASLVVLAAEPGDPAAAMVSAATFGAAYVMLSGHYLVMGTRILADRPALGPVLPLIATASGQVVGAAASGKAIAESGHVPAFLAFAAFGIVVAVLSYATFLEIRRRVGLAPAQ
ncbi:MAG: MFS transporter [Azospirillaceae bacterium]